MAGMRPYTLLLALAFDLGPKCDRPSGPHRGMYGATLCAMISSSAGVSPSF